MPKSLRNERIGKENFNNEGYSMKIVEYKTADNIIVEFQDEYKQKVNTTYDHFIKGKVSNPHKNRRLGETRYNNQGSLMKIVEYNNSHDVIIEYQDKYRFKRRTYYSNFVNGCLDNPYFPTVCGVGIVGDMKKYTSKNIKVDREYNMWRGIIHRCYDKECKIKYPTYKEATCCKDWLLFENFYEWIHSQENFDNWNKCNDFDIDKDILIKGNKVYSPETCCLVPSRVNYLFVNKKNKRGNLPIGVTRDKNRYSAQCNDINCKHHYIGSFNNPEEAFNAYKVYKEKIIKQVALVEYDKGNITKQCYEAMMRYEVEITD